MGRSNRRRAAALADFENWLAPWEKDAEGKEIPEDQQVIDKDSLAKYIHGLLADKARLQGEVDTATAERDEAVTALEQVESGDEGGDVKALQAEIERLKAAPPQVDEVAQRRDAAMDYVAEQYPHLTLKQVRRVVSRAQGDDQDDMNADVDGLLEDFGLDKAPAPKADGETETTPDERPGMRRTPRGRTGGDPEGGQGGEPNPLEGKTANDLYPSKF